MFNSRNLQRRVDAKAEPFGFIFDLDGAVVDSAAHHVAAWQKVLAERGVSKSPQLVEVEYYGTNIEIPRRFFGHGLSNEDAATVSQRQTVIFREIYRPKLRLIDGLKKFLDDARAMNIPMALAGDANLELIQDWVESLYLGSYFKVIVTAEDIERGKPSPDGLLKAALRLGLMPEDCIAFDDSAMGIEAALRANIKVFAVQSTGNKAAVGKIASGQPNIIQTIADYRTLRPALAHTYSKMIAL